MSAFFRLPGTGTGRVFAPDSAAVSITGDLDVAILLSADDWTPGAIQTFIGHYSTSGSNRGWDVRLNTGGTLSFVWSVLGSSAIVVNSTAATGFTNGTVHWVRVVHDVDNGAAGNNVLFYTSNDAITTAPGSVTWTQLGTTVTSAGTTSHKDSAATLTIGANTAGTANIFAGNVYVAELRSGIVGTVVASPDFRTDAQTADGGGTFTDTQGNVWTPTTASVWIGWPSNVVATPDSSTQITVSWNNVVLETGFIVEQSLDGLTGWTNVSGTLAANTLSYADTGLTGSTQYFYRVSSVFTYATSDPSPVVDATTDATPPFAHYDASTLGLSNGATVTTWPDLSGNGNDLAQTGGISLPTYETPSLNGMGGVKFDATHQRIADTSLSGSPTAARTIFAVIKNPADSGAVRHITLTTNLLIAKWSTANRWIFGNSSAGGQFIEFTEAGIENATGQWTYVHQQTGAEIRWNQVQKVTGNIGAPAADSTIVLGASDANTSMTLYEWVVYNGVLSAGEIDAVEDYLFNKWFVAPPATITVNQAPEVESAQPITPLISREVTVGQAVEAELGQTIDPQIARRVTVNQASETELGQPVTPVIGRMVPVGTAAEAEAANPVTPRINRVVTIGIATEVELARLISPIKPIIIPVQTAVERELARLVTPFKGQPFIPGITCEVLTLGVDCAILALNVDCEQP